MDMITSIVRGVLGLLLGDTAELWRHGLYRAEVKSCASDGSTVDLQPEDPRVVGHKSVPVLIGIPGAVAVVESGTVMLIGWQKGDPTKPYAIPCYEQGAGVTSLKFTVGSMSIEFKSNKITVDGGTTLDLKGTTINMTGDVKVSGTLDVS